MNQKMTNQIWQIGLFRASAICCGIATMIILTMTLLSGCAADEIKTYDMQPVTYAENAPYVTDTTVSGVRAVRFKILTEDGDETVTKPISHVKFVGCEPHETPYAEEGGAFWTLHIPNAEDWS